PALPDGAMAGARKGSGNYALVFRGRAAHVGRAFTDGRSAIAAAARATLDLLECNGKHAGVTFNVGAIDGGGPVNQVPDRAVVRFNARAPDAAGALWAEAEIARIVTALDGRDGVRAQVHGGFTRPPKPMTPQQERLIGWTRAAGDLLGLALPFAPTGGVCEGNNLAAAGCPNIDTLGPCGGELHCEREFARIASFAPRAKLSLLLLAGFESGVFDAPALRG
ncbi:MAG: peptidase dimerization domain-containing protein, partial [Hyphomonadaceae bacterium]